MSVINLKIKQEDHNFCHEECPFLDTWNCTCLLFKETISTVKTKDKVWYSVCESCKHVACKGDYE